MIIRFSGGLGNQMFQYAYLLAQKERYPNEEILADVSDYDDYIHHNGFELNNIFHLDISFCSEEEKKAHHISMSLWNKILRKLGFKNAGFPKCIKDKEDGFDAFFLGKFEQKDFLWGYWHCERYFENIKDELHKIYSFPPLSDDENIKLSTSIKTTESVSVHVRRGDYLGIGNLVQLCDTNYYSDAFKRLRLDNTKQLTWFVFSDDIEWCKENLNLKNEQVYYVSNNKGNNSFRDMQLMSLCKYMIISNSTFSWWAAWLNSTAKLIIAPDKFFTDRDKYNKDIYPADWERINL